MEIIYERVKIKLVRDEDSILFPELQKEGFKEGQIVKADRQIINGTDTRSFYFGNNCVAYEGETAFVVKS